MRNNNFKERSSESDVDITPMLDVVFIMLIFFVVTASFVKEQAIGLNVPDDVINSQPADHQPIVLNIDADNMITIDGRSVDIRAIESLIVRMTAERPLAAVAVRVDGKANTKTVIGAIDGIRSANVLHPSVKIKTS